MSKHSKKRNSWLVYEFLVRTISEALVNDEKKKSSVALKILKRHFKPGTELYKEFRVANALMKTTVSSEHVAASILKEAKETSKSYNERQLDREKSLLIRNINHRLNDASIFDKHVAEYKMAATIQTLMNEWRSASDIAKIAEYEDVLMKWLVSEKAPIASSIVTEESPGTARLLMKVMSKKLNEKYAGKFNEDQQAIIKSYAFSSAQEDTTTIKMKLEEVRNKLLVSMKKFEREENNTDFMRKKIDEVREKLVAENVNELNDALVTRFMSYAKLVEEIETGE